MVTILGKQQTETENGGRTVGKKAGWIKGGDHIYIYIHLYIYTLVNK